METIRADHLGEHGRGGGEGLEAEVAERPPALLANLVQSAEVSAHVAALHFLATGGTFDQPAIVSKALAYEAYELFVGTAAAPDLKPLGIAGLHRALFSTSTASALKEMAELNEHLKERVIKELKVFQKRLCSSQKGS